MNLVRSSTSVDECQARPRPWPMAKWTTLGLCFLVVSPLSNAEQVDTDPLPFVAALSTKLRQRPPSFEKRSLLFRSIETATTSTSTGTGSYDDCTPIHEESCDAIVPTLSLPNMFTFDAKSLVQPGDLNTILSQPNVDYKNTKSLQEQEDKVVADTDCVSDLPSTILDAEYPLIINHLELHWEPVARLARQFEMEFQTSHDVSCSLHVMPVEQQKQQQCQSIPTTNDVDVIVLQLRGEMRWSVWKETRSDVSAAEDSWQQEPLPPPPRSFNSPEWHASRYADFALYANNVLYIPRGTLHSATATTTTPLLKQQQHNEPASSILSWYLVFRIDPMDYHGSSRSGGGGGIIRVADWISLCFLDHNNNATSKFLPLIRTATEHFSSLQRVVIFQENNAKLTVRAMFQTALHDFRMWVGRGCKHENDADDDGSCQPATVPTVYWEDAMAKYEELAKKAAELPMDR